MSIFHNYHVGDKIKQYTAKKRNCRMAFFVVVNPHQMIFFPLFFRVKWGGVEGRDRAERERDQAGNATQVSVLDLDSDLRPF